AGMADRYAVVRSLMHTGGGHPAGSLQMLSGDPDAADKLEPRYPDWMCIANHLRSQGPRAIPNYIAINPVDRYDSFTIAGPAYLGGGTDAFKVYGDPSRPEFEVPNIGLGNASQRSRLQGRVSLRASLDQLPRAVDQSGLLEASDRFETQAVNMLLSPETRTAFDL